MKKIVVHRIPTIISLVVGAIMLLTTMLTGVVPAGVHVKLSALFSKADSQLFLATPNPIQVCGGATTGNTVLTWNSAPGVQVEVRKSGETGELVASGTGPGSQSVSGVGNNARYYLYQLTQTRRYNRITRTWDVVTSRAELAQLSVAHTQDGCTGITPPTTGGSAKLSVAGATASHTLAGSVPGNAIDSNPSTLWNSGAFPSQWIELDLGSAKTISSLKLLVSQLPAGVTTHEVRAGASQALENGVVHTFNQETSSGQWLVYNFPSPLVNIRYLRITTTSSPSWVAWSEVEVYGPAPFVTVGGDNAFQLSAWIHLGLKNSARGYWGTYGSSPEDTQPSLEEVANAKRVLRTTYKTNQLYLIYHRQFEIERAKQVFLDWKNAQVQGYSSQALVPTLVLQNYADNGCNFTNTELTNLVSFLRDNVNSAAIGILDIYNVSGANPTDSHRNFCNQAGLVKSVHGGELYRIGIQPGEPLVSPFTKAVEDTYGGVSAGKTNENWATDCGFGYPSAKDLLASWVDERVSSNQKVAFDFINVAFNYNLNPPCGTDNTIAGGQDDPLPVGRNRLAHDTIVSRYVGGGANPNWTGFSFDGAILEVWDSSFYSQLKAGQSYTGIYAGPLNEIATIYGVYNSH